MSNKTTLTPYQRVIINILILLGNSAPRHAIISQLKNIRKSFLLDNFTFALSLMQLKRRGLVSSEIINPPDGVKANACRFYRLTDKGLSVIANKPLLEK